MNDGQTIAAGNAALALGNASQEIGQLRADVAILRMALESIERIDLSRGSGASASILRYARAALSTTQKGD